MTKRGAEIIISSAFIILGAVLILNACSGMTGYVVFQDVGVQTSSILGLAMFIGGIMLLAYERSQTDFKKSIDSIVDLYESGRINSISAADRINRLRTGKQIKGVDYAGGKALLVKTRRGDVPINVKNQEKALELFNATYFTSLINDRGNSKNSKVEITQGKIPYLDQLKGGLTEYMTQYSQEHLDDLKRMAQSRT